MIDGTQILSAAVIASSAMAPTNWHIADTGDFNNDGKSDILWRADDGSVGIWLIDGTQILSAAVIAPSGIAPNNWHISGTGDFNNDGKSDILWRADDGTVAIWGMNGTQIVSTQIVSTLNNTLHSPPPFLAANGSSDPTASNFGSENQANVDGQIASVANSLTATISGGPIAATSFAGQSEKLVASSKADLIASSVGGYQAHELNNFPQSYEGTLFGGQQSLPESTAGPSLLKQYMASSIITSGDGGTPASDTLPIPVHEYAFLTHPQHV